MLAHRGSLWTLLRSVCQTVWDHSCRIGVFAAQRELPVAPDQLQDTLTSLLVLSADLIMDMMHRLGVMITASTTFNGAFLFVLRHYRNLSLVISCGVCMTGTLLKRSESLLSTTQPRWMTAHAWICAGSVLWCYIPWSAFTTEQNGKAWHTLA